MRNFIVVGMLCLFAMNGYAQKFSWNFNEEEKDDRISPAVKEKIEEYSLEVRKVVIEEKIKMDVEIDSVQAKFLSNSISSFEAEERKREISNKYAGLINERIDTISFDLDEITKKQVEYTILNTDVKMLSKEQKYQTLEQKHKATNEVVGYLSYGIMSFPNDEDETLNKHLGFSSGIDFGLLYHKQFSRESPWTFITGTYFSWRTIRFDDDYMIDRSDEGDVSLVKYEKNLDKSKLRSTYVMVPVGIKYSFSKLTKVNDDFSYRNTSKGFSIGANLYGGFLISKNNIVKGEGINTREKGTNYNLNPFVYGAQATLSINNVNFFIRQDLSSYFKDETFDDRKMLQFGLNFGF